jgi:hypothetical protein
MYLEGAPRILASGAHIPGLAAGDAGRVVLEGYPGLTIRQISRASYKNDAASHHTPERAAARAQIIECLLTPNNPLGIALKAEPALIDQLHNDPSGDALDAAVCALQAAWASLRAAEHYGLPAAIDPLEGWILTAPTPPNTPAQPQAR